MIADLDTLEYKLKKRGFRRDDLLLHTCVKCNVQAVATYTGGPWRRRPLW